MLNYPQPRERSVVPVSGGNLLKESSMVNLLCGCLLIRSPDQRLHHRITLNHPGSLNQPSHITTQTVAACAFAVMPSPPVSDRLISVSASVTEAVFLPANPQQFPLCRRQYFLFWLAVILCFFTDTFLPQAQHPYRDKRLDNHHAPRLSRSAFAVIPHVPPLFHALWYSSISQRRS